MVRVVPIQHRAPLAHPRPGVSGETGSWRWIRPVVDNDKCVRCYLCEIYCPDNTILVDPEKGAIVDYMYCKGCGVCAAVCPAGAIEMRPEQEG